MITINNKVIKINNKWINIDLYNPLGLPPYTVRLKYQQGTFTPSFSKGTGVLVDAGENIWDLTYENNDWSHLLYAQSYLLEVLGANSTGVTNMEHMMDRCSYLTTVAIFDTSSVTHMNSMFEYSSALTTVSLFDTSSVTLMYTMFLGCSSLTSIPLFNTSSVTNMNAMFRDCVSVQSGALALYQQASSQPNPPRHDDSFTRCGSNTQTGRAELAQIPQDWGGTMQE